MEYVVQISSEQETVQLATDLEHVLPEQVVIALSGNLGAGKTRFVQAFAESAGVPPNTVTSPTFVLCQHYQGRRQIHHLDAYRLESPAEFFDLGGDELQMDAAVTFVEWGKRVEPALSKERLEIDIEINGDQARTFRFSTNTPALVSAIEQLHKRREARGN